MSAPAATTWIYDFAEGFHAAGVHSVSCSPFRVPIARVTAAQAAGR